jgi:hypothetical protein
MNTGSIFRIGNTSEFNSIALEAFNYQYNKNLIYKEFSDLLGKNPITVNNAWEIPFLPIEFFRTEKIFIGDHKPTIVFSSSGTTGMQASKHHINDLAIYIKSFRLGFKHFYGNIKDYCILALLPSYLEREGSSLIYMVNDLIQESKHPDSGFYLNNLKELAHKLQILDNSGSKILLIGVSFALLDLAEQFPLQLKNTIVMETGGMKGRRKEMIRTELHSKLKTGFGLHVIHSEYGMTELLSQAYSAGNGIFYGPPWMKILVRDTEDPLSLQPHGKTGGINIIDLANIHSCCFLATQDLGKLHDDGGFEILGRFDNADIRGCNLMVL